MRKRKATDLEILALGALMGVVHLAPGAGAIIGMMESRLKLDTLHPEYQQAIREISERQS